MKIFGYSHLFFLFLALSFVTSRVLQVSRRLDDDDGDSDLFEKLTKKQKKQATLILGQMEKMEPKDQKETMKLISDIYSPNATSGERKERKLLLNRKLNLKNAVIGISAAVGGLMAMGILKPMVQLWWYKRQWKPLEKQLFYSNLEKRRDVQELGAKVSELHNEVGSFSDRFDTKSKALSHFVNSHQMY